MRKMKRLTSVFALLLVASLLVSNAEVLANSSDGKHYTYTYDCWDVDRAVSYTHLTLPTNSRV